MRDRFLSTLSLVCRLPLPARFAFDLSRADFYLPLIGLFPAILGLAAFYGAHFLFHSITVATLTALAAQYLGFNLFHLDGLVDTADAFLGDFDREKRFAILKDSRIGVYGLFAGVTLLALKGALLTSLLAGRGPGVLLLFGAYPITGRWAAALIPSLTGPAKPEGLGALLAASKIRRAVAGLGFSLVLYAPLMAAGSPSPVFALLGLAPVLSGVPTAFGVARLYKTRLGGYTGDALGAAVELGELAHLAAALLLQAAAGG
jgi:adenosylcobinamide-GDP ribazoletransferase